MIIAKWWENFTCTTLKKTPEGRSDLAYCCNQRIAPNETSGENLRPKQAAALQTAKSQGIEGLLYCKGFKAPICLSKFHSFWWVNSDDSLSWLSWGISSKKSAPPNVDLPSVPPSAVVARCHLGCHLSISNSFISVFFSPIQNNLLDKTYKNLQDLHVFQIIMFFMLFVAKITRQRATKLLQCMASAITGCPVPQIRKKRDRSWHSIDRQWKLHSYSEICLVGTRDSNTSKTKIYTNICYTSIDPK